MLYMRFENQQTNRYYRILLAKDMFNDWVLTKVWGGINQATGRIMHIPCETLHSALSQVQHIMRTRLKRGYIIVEKKFDDNTMHEHDNIISLITIE